MTQSDQLTSGIDDPVLAKRQRIERLVGLGLKIGYGLFGLAMVLFFASLIGDFRSAVTTAIVWCLALGSVVLAPAMVFKYAIKAAYRADREGSW